MSSRWSYCSTADVNSRFSISFDLHHQLAVDHLILSFCVQRLPPLQCARTCVSINCNDLGLKSDPRRYYRWPCYLEWYHRDIDVSHASADLFGCESITYRCRIIRRLVVRYSLKLDALRIFVLLLLQAGKIMASKYTPISKLMSTSGGTTLFTLHSATIPCNAFGKYLL